MIQIAADAHWNAIAGGYKVDELSVTMRVREYLEDFWQKCSQNQAVKAILLRAAAWEALEPNHRTAELMQRGLLDARLQPFCPFFSEVIKESMPKGKSLLAAAKACEREPGAVLRFLERWLPWVERFIKLRNSWKGQDDDKGDKS